MTIPRNLSNLAPGASTSGVLDVAHGGTGVTTSTGSGDVVLSTSPALTTPDIGTPSAATLTNATGLPLSTGVTGTLAVTNGGTGSSTAFTTGSVVFAGASGVYSQDNAQLFWDDTNNRLGVGTATPGEQVSITASAPTFSMSTPVDGNRVEQRYYNEGTKVWTVGLNYNGSDGHYFFQRNFGGGNILLAPDGNGAVAIGTDSPIASLDVYSGTGAATVFARGSGSYYANFYATSGSYNILNQVSGTTGVCLTTANATSYSVGTVSSAPLNFIMNNGTVGTFDTSSNFKFNSGYGSVATAYGCRAWVNFNGTGTVSVRVQGNVSSISDNGTGDYTINFLNAMPDANYSVSGSSGGQAATSNGAIYQADNSTAKTTTAFRILLLNTAGGTVDTPQIACAVFR